MKTIRTTQTVYLPRSRLCVRGIIPASKYLRRQIKTQSCQAKLGVDFPDRDPTFRLSAFFWRGHGTTRISAVSLTLTAGYDIIKNKHFSSPQPHMWNGDTQEVSKQMETGAKRMKIDKKYGLTQGKEFRDKFLTSKRKT